MKYLCIIIQKQLNIDNVMKIIIILFFLSSNVPLFGQQISSTVFEMNGETPVEFVNIGIVGKNVGTVSDRNGNYTLQIPAEFHDDTLKFSSIGYEAVTMLVSDFINRNNDTIFMKEKQYPIREVVVTPRTETLILGNRRKGLAAFFLSDLYENRGMEIGIILDPRNNKVFLKKLTLNDVMINFSLDGGKTFVDNIEGQDTMLFRLNLYNVNSRNEFENILTQPVYIKWDTNNKVYLKEFDISEHNLVIENKTLLTLEFFDDISARSNIRFNGTIFGPDTYIRNSSQDSWQKRFNSVGIFVEAIKL